jgi:hypothetical protein
LAGRASGIPQRFTHLAETLAHQQKKELRGRGHLDNTGCLLDVRESQEACERFVEQRRHPVIGRVFAHAQFQLPAEEPPRQPVDVQAVWLASDAVIGAWRELFASVALARKQPPDSRAEPEEPTSGQYQTPKQHQQQDCSHRRQ